MKLLKCIIQFLAFRVLLWSTPDDDLASLVAIHALAAAMLRDAKSQEMRRRVRA